MKTKIVYLTMAIVLAISLTIVARTLARPEAAGDDSVPLWAFQMTYTPGVSGATFDFSTAETVDGSHSAKLGVKNLQNDLEGVKIGFYCPPFAEFEGGGLQNIDASSISLKVKGNLLYEGIAAHSPYPIIVVNLGHDTEILDPVVIAHGVLVYFYATDSSGGGPRNTVNGAPELEWATVTPEYPQYWKGFFLDGHDLGEVLDVPGAIDLASWNTAVIGGYPLYFVIQLGVGYGFVYDSTGEYNLYPAGATAYVDDLAVNGATYNFEPSNAAGGDCFIATAAYGTPTAAELDTLRAFRDEVLLQNRLGSRLVNFYYEVSPPVADFISEHSPLRTLVRELVIEPMVGLAKLTQGIWGD